MDIKVCPRGLRLKFEPSAQPVFGAKFGCKVPHFTVHYKGECVACAASGVSRAKSRQESFNSRFGNPDGCSFFLSRTSCNHNNPDGILVWRRMRGTTDGRNAGATQHNRNVARIV